VSAVLGSETVASWGRVGVAKNSAMNKSATAAALSWAPRASIPPRVKLTTVEFVMSEFMMAGSWAVHRV
jgi:hypothetical protein